MLSNPKPIVLGAVILLWAGSGSAAFAAQEEREADHAALRALRDKVATAIEKQDTKALASCFAKDFVFIAVTQTVITNEAQAQEFFDRMFHSDNSLLAGLKTEPKPAIPTRFLDANTGVCYGTSKDSYTLRSGKVVQMNVCWSATVVKENGAWKVAMAQVGTDFLDNPVVQGAKALARNLGFGAGLGGLVLGAVLGWSLLRGQRASQASQPKA